MRQKDRHKLFDKEIPITGEVSFNMAEMVRLWDETFWLSQWKEDFRLIKEYPTPREEAELKFNISKKDAHELIVQLGLTRKQGFFTSSGSWRVPLHHRWHKMRAEVRLYKLKKQGKHTPEEISQMEAMIAQEL